MELLQQNQMETPEGTAVSYFVSTYYANDIPE
jgi:hypothetical protein